MHLSESFLVINKRTILRFKLVQAAVRTDIDGQ